MILAAVELMVPRNKFGDTASRCPARQIDEGLIVGTENRYLGRLDIAE